MVTLIQIYRHVVARNYPPPFKARVTYSRDHTRATARPHARAHRAVVCELRRARYRLLVIDRLVSAIGNKRNNKNHRPRARPAIARRFGCGWCVVVEQPESATMPPSCLTWMRREKEQVETVEQGRTFPLLEKLRELSPPPPSLSLFAPFSLSLAVQPALPERSEIFRTRSRSRRLRDSCARMLCNATVVQSHV